MISIVSRRKFAWSSALSLLSFSLPPAALAREPPEPATPEAEPLPETGAEEATGADDFVEEGDDGSGTEIFSADTFSLILDARLVLTDGNRSWVDRGFGKTRFDGKTDGDFQARVQPVEAALIWQPRITRTVNGLVSAAWQQGHDDEDVDLLEAFLTFIPTRSGNTNFSFKAGLYWPEISLEHATGGAWSTVYTLTPSAINSWVGEEVKLVGAEATLYQTIGETDLSLTAGIFGFNDTSGTLLSFRGWALHDVKATLFGQFPLPPLNPFMTVAQQNVTRSTIEIDDRPGFYGRVEWRPSSNLVLNLFYYDNRGDPEAFTPNLQWGWRTRFWNLGVAAELGPNTRLIGQAMTGTTLMGFIPPGETREWVDTRFRSAFVLLSHRIGEGAVSGRIEAFDTKERGSRMVSAEENESGWAATLAVRWPVWDKLTLFIEALHVESKRGGRARLDLPRKESQTLLQAALRFRW